jgi:hypothetical protein
MIIVYRWRIRDPKRRSGWRELTWSMTEEEAAKWAATQGVVEYEKVEGSAEKRTPLPGVMPSATQIKPKQ